VLTSKATGADENGAIALTLTSTVVKAAPASMTGGGGNPGRGNPRTFGDELTAIGNAARLQRPDERARRKASGRLSAKEKCFLVLACIGLLLGSAFLRRQSAFGFFFQRAGELR
jgi:hypothetical protein